MPDPVICVLGMHRSGTSCLIGSLQKAGLNLGKHHTRNRFNQRGSRENQDIVDLNNAVLEHSGGSWRSPPPQLRFTEGHLSRARDIVASFPAGLRWGFKDPRSLLTLPLWEAVLGERLSRLGIFRHPLAVAASLARRDGAAVLPESRALRLWQHYNERLLALHRQAAFPVLCFDWPEAEFHARLNAVLASLDLAPIDDDNRFYAPELKHFESRDRSLVPRSQRRTYDRLMKLCD